MARESGNCTVCAEEFPMDELKSIALSTVHVTNYKICINCIAKANPEDDYLEVRSIVDSYLNSNKNIK